MFKIEYQMQDGGPCYHCKYPAKKDENHNFFFIKGTNDLGKTTSETMVALGLFANKSYQKDNDAISDSLKAKMEYLLSEDIEKMCFNFEISSQDKSTVISSQYHDRELITKLNGQSEDWEYFNEHIQVIYDVPDDPIVKLDTSIRLIRDNLIEYEKYLKRYRSGISDIITGIQDFKNKDAKIKKNEDQLKKIEGQLKTKRDLLSRIESEITDFDRTVKVINYVEMREEFNKSSDELTNLKEKRRELKGKGIGAVTPKFKKIVADFNDANNKTKASLQKVIHYVNILTSDDLKKVKKIEKTLVELFSPRDLKIKEIETFSEYIKQLQSILLNDPINEQYTDEQKQYEMVTKLKDVVRDYLEIKMNIPGTNQEDAYSFYRELESFLKDLEPKLAKKKDLSELIKELSRLLVSLSDLKTKRTTIPDKDEKSSADYENIENSIKKLTGDLERLQVSLLVDKGIIDGMSDEEIRECFENPWKKESLAKDKKEFTDLTNEIQKLEINKNSIKLLLEQFGELEAPSELDEERYSNELHDCELLLGKISKWRKILEPVNFKKKDLGIERNSTSDELFGVLSEYFADILQNVHYEKKPWRVLQVDLLNRCYHIEGRKPIKFIQMGTGHTALNSLLARIKPKVGGKKKIILLDEMGHMDQQNIGILTEEIKNQIQRGETLFALMTFADNTVSEVTWEPIEV